MAVIYLGVLASFGSYYLGLIFTTLPSFLIIIIQERPKEAGIQMIQYKRQEVFIEFETCWELVGYLKLNWSYVNRAIMKIFLDPDSYPHYISISTTYLPDTVNELQKYRTAVIVVMFVITMSNSVGKFMSKTEPFFFN